MPVTLLQLLELDADDAGEGGAHEGSLKRGLAQPTREEVDVIHAAVNLQHVYKCETKSKQVKPGFKTYQLRGPIYLKNFWKNSRFRQLELVIVAEKRPKKPDVFECFKRR